MSNSWIKQEDHATVNIILCLLLVLIESLQLLIVLVLIFSFIPIPVSPMVHELFPRFRQDVFPKRDLFFYRFWVGTVILGQAVLLGSLRNQLSGPQLGRRLRPFCAVEALWLFLMVFTVFKIFVYGHPAWGMPLLYAVLAGSLLSKIFWKELCNAAKFSYSYISEHHKVISRAADFIFPLVIAGLIFVPDLQAVAARMWIGDSLIHMDGTLMGQAWAYLNGAILNVDVYAHYGLGMPIFVALLAKSLGIFSYTGVLSVLIWATVIYFILCYFFLRVWLKSVPLAIAGVLIAIKWQMFHPGVYPFVFTYPYSTVCRYLFDIIFLFLLLAHIRRGNFYFLAAAGAVCGLALFYISDTGVYLLLAYVFYLFWLAIEAKAHGHQHWRNIVGRTVFCAGIVFLSAFVLLYAFQGTHTWSKDFWAHMAERVELFLIGHGNLPMYKSLLDGDYLASLMSFVMPLVYCAVLVAVFSLCILKKIHRRHIMAAVLCVYGMGLYNYYVCRSANTSYYFVCVPFVFVLCWLCCQWGQSLNTLHRHAWWGILLGISTFALFSNHAYLSYPNIFNFSPNPILAPTVKWPNKDLPYYFNNTPRGINPSLKLPANSLGEKDEGLKIETDFKTDAELKDYFNSEFDYPEDAALIDSLTSRDQPVPLISSFETRILMQADRKPFFYYFPLIDSRPRRMRIFPFSELWTINRLNVTINQFERSKPPYVFVERILLTPQVPQVYEYLYPEFLYILAYLDKYYKPYRYGKYLVALKRI